MIAIDEMEKKKKQAEYIISTLERKSRFAFVFSQVFNQSLLPSCIVSLQGNFLEVNEALCRFFEMEERILLSKTWQELTHPDYLEIDRELVQECIDRKREGYFLPKIYTPNGKEKKADLVVSYIETPTGDCFLSQIIPESFEKWIATGQH